MDIKIIKTEEEYEQALSRLEALMDAAPGSPEEDELDLLSLLIEKYEKEHYPIGLPDPVEAILFRMEQQGLTPKDMIQYLGSQSKVSEVLNRKRPLSLTMIRNLHRGLDIPIEVLIQETEPVEIIPANKEPEVHGYDSAYFNCFQLENEAKLNKLRDWLSRTTAKANKQQLPTFEWKRLDEGLFTELIRLGSYTAGPRMAGELLNKKGIHLIVQKPAFETTLDGACFFSPKQRPIISLTLRNDRLDNFWLMLLHLLAHLYLHQSKKPIAIFESLDCIFDKTAPQEEIQANEFIKKIVIPEFGNKFFQVNFTRSSDLETLIEETKASDISPEILSCLLRLENKFQYHDFNEVLTKKIGEKLEVYG